MPSSVMPSTPFRQAPCCSDPCLRSSGIRILPPHLLFLYSSGDWIQVLKFAILCKRFTNWAIPLSPTFFPLARYSAPVPSSVFQYLFSSVLFPRTFFILIFFLMCMRVLPANGFGYCLSAWCQWRPEEGDKYPGTGVKEAVYHHLGAWNWAQVLWKRNGWF